MQHAITILEVLGVLAVLFVAAAVVTRQDDLLVETPADDRDLELPHGPLQPEDVRRVRFGMVLRGYRMREVDRVLERVAAELAARDARLLALEQALVDVVEPHVEEAEQRLSAPAQGTEPTAEPADEPRDHLVRTPDVDPAPDPAPDPEIPPAWARPMNPSALVPQPLAPAATSEPAPRWPQPDLETEPESLPALSELGGGSEAPAEPAAPAPPDDSAFSGAAADDSAFSGAAADDFPEVLRADDEPQP